MNRGAKMLLWAGGTLFLSVIAAILFGPEVLLGVVIGVAMTTLKDIHMEGQ